MRLYGHIHYPCGDGTLNARERGGLARSVFLTPEEFACERFQKVGSLRGRLLIASCRSGSHLASRVIQHYQGLLAEKGSSAPLLHLDDIDFRFMDSETCVRLDLHVGGYDVFLFQGLYDPTDDRSVDENYMACLIAARTFRQHGAEHVTAVLPYLAYSRQDKPTAFKREPNTAKLMADLAIEAGIDRLITWQPHSTQVGGFYGNIPVEALESLTLFMREFQDLRGRQDVIIVAPDAGATKFATLLGRALNLSPAIASKFRPHPEEAEITEIIGDFQGKRLALIPDDMISSGGTVYALVKKLVQEKGIERVQIAVAHNLCMDVAYARLVELHQHYGLERLLVTNSIPQTEDFRSLPFVVIRDLAKALARVINRIHYNQSVSELFYPSVRDGGEEG